MPAPPAPQALAATARRFGIDPKRLSLVRNVANVVYSAAAEDGPTEAARFLRLSHRDDHTPQQVEAEIEWLRFLAAEGLRVCRPLPARDGRFVVPTGATHSAVLFARVPGEPVGPERFDPPLFREMGRFLGRLHRTSGRFQPADPARVRPQWFECDPPARVLGSWSRDDPGDVRAARAWMAVRERLLSPDRPSGRFGLVHADLHRNNVFREDGRLAVIDFDDSCYFFLVADVANALYYALWDRRYDPERERSAFAASFLEQLVAGYREHHVLEDEALQLLPDLLEYRELSVDAFSHRRLGTPDAEAARRWRHVRERLARSDPYVDLGGVLPDP